MLHFGLMDESKMSHEAATLLRANLPHLRYGRRRLREGKVASGRAIFYDAVCIWKADQVGSLLFVASVSPFGAKEGVKRIV